MTRGWRRVATGAVAVAMAVSACSGVPRSSSPEIIGPAADAGTGSQPAITPQPGAEAREIVTEFLRTNAGEPTDPRGAHLFLSPAEQSKWSDDTVTILQQSPEVGVAIGNPAHVTVSGTEVGRVAADGTYMPYPAAPGGGGEPVSFDFTLAPVDGQWRISDLPDGLIVTAPDFSNVYRESRLYFYDLAEQHLVPDPRQTALTSLQDIASWQLRELVAGPRQQLASAVRTELPSHIAPSERASVTVTPGPLVSVELPGSSQLDASTKRKLAAQLVATFGQLQAQTSMTITDGGRPIDIPSVPERFTRANIAAVTSLFKDVEPPVFYINGRGVLVDANGKAVGGAFATAQLHLTSVALADRSSPNYAVAATTGPPSARALWVGRLNGLLREVDLSDGPLTRPSFAPGRQEAWVGENAHLYRVSESGVAASVPTGLPGGRVKALRFSADGTRLAMIVLSPDGASQVWVGAVIRVGATVRVDSPQPITPRAYAFTDIAWNDDTTLYVIGTDPSDNFGVWSVQVDGSSLQARPVAGLPQAPDSITAAPRGGLPAWVSAGGAVFEETSDWAGPNGRTTIGTQPIYLE